MDIHMTCSCQASMNVGGIGADIGIKMLTAWNKQHARCAPSASYNRSTTDPSADWREKYVGMPCSACDEPLNRALELTTKNGRPVHASNKCLGCRLCNKVAGSRSWLDEATQLAQIPLGVRITEPTGLFHVQCLKDKYMTQADEAK
jgi:hypothetical protein